jgi:hypothetical protein
MKVFTLTKLHTMDDFFVRLPTEEEELEIRTGNIGDNKAYIVGEGDEASSILKEGDWLYDKRQDDSGTYLLCLGQIASVKNIQEEEEK